MKESSTLLDEYYLQDKAEEASSASQMVSVINNSNEVKVVLYIELVRIVCISCACKVSFL